MRAEPRVQLQHPAGGMKMTPTGSEGEAKWQEESLVSVRGLVVAACKEIFLP
jgi:hypothetical protein